jgi:hypothetical protein
MQRWKHLIKSGMKAFKLSFDWYVGLILAHAPPFLVFSFSLHPHSIPLTLKASSLIGCFSLVSCLPLDV